MPTFFLIKSLINRNFRLKSAFNEVRMHCQINRFSSFVVKFHFQIILSLNKLRFLHTNRNELYLDITYNTYHKKISHYNNVVINTDTSLQ